MVWSVALVLAGFGVSGIFAYLSANIKNEDNNIFQSFFFIMSILISITSIGMMLHVASVNSADIYTIMVGSVYNPLIIVFIVLVAYLTIMGIKYGIENIKFKRRVR